MSKPPSETRVLLLILGVIGLMSCGCLCVPLGLIGLGIGLPAAVQVRKAANRVAERDRMAAQAPPAFDPQPMPAVPAEFQPLVPSEVPQFRPPQFTPAPEGLPPDVPPPIRPEFRWPPEIPPAPKAPPAPAARGLAALSESRKRFLHRAATIHRNVLEMFEKQRAQAQQRGLNTDSYDQMLEQTKTRLDEQLDRLCKSHNLTRAELEQIIAEGDEQGWSGRPATKK
jgi:hypothetical protein